MPVIPTQATIWTDKIKTHVHAAKHMGSFKADHYDRVLEKETLVYWKVQPGV